MRFKLPTLATYLLLTNAKKSNWLTKYVLESIPMDLSEPDKD